MDEPSRLQISNEALHVEINAAKQLLDDAHKIAPALPAQLVEPRKEGRNQQGAQVAAPVTAEERLQFANKAATEVSNRFAELDISDNRLLGEHELASASKNIPGSQVLLNHYNDIIPLYYDHLNAYKSTISQDHLGISQGDLAGFKAVTSSNHDDLLSYARSQIFNTRPGQAGILLGGVTAGTSVVAGALGLMRIRSGLAGLGIGLGIIGAGAAIGYFTEKSQLESLRGKIGTDTALDSLISKDRYK